MEDESSIVAQEVVSPTLQEEVEENEQVASLRPAPSCPPARPPSFPSRPLSPPPRALYSELSSSPRPPPPPQPPASLNKPSVSSEPTSFKALPPAGRPSLTFGPPPSRPSVSSSATPAAPSIAIRDLWMGSAGLVEEEADEGDEGEQQEVDADEGDSGTPCQSEIVALNASQVSSVSSTVDALGTLSLSESESVGLNLGAFDVQASKGASLLSGLVSSSALETLPLSSTASNVAPFSASNSSLSSLPLSNVPQNRNALTSPSCFLKESKQEDDEDDEKSGPVDKYGRPIRAAADVKKKRTPGGGGETTSASDSSSTIPFIFAPMHLRTSEGFVPGNTSESSGKKIKKSTRSPASNIYSPSSSAAFSAFSAGGESLPSFSDVATASLGSFTFSSSFGSPSSDFIFPTGSSGSGPLFGAEFKHSDFAAAAQQAASNESATQEANSAKAEMAE